MKLKITLTPKLKQVILDEKKAAVQDAMARNDVPAMKKATTEVNRFLNKTKEVPLPEAQVAQ